MPHPRKPDPVKHCVQCGNLMVRKRFPSALESLHSFKRRQFCDQTCMAASMEGQIKVLNPRSSRKQSQKTVLANCENCGRNDTGLYVHHVNGNPLVNDPSNLRTLCGSCHQLAHTQLSGRMPQRLRPCIYCSLPARHRGLCNTHYSRWQRNGSVLITKRWNGHGEPVYLEDFLEPSRPH